MTAAQLLATFFILCAAGAAAALVAPARFSPLVLATIGGLYALVMLLVSGLILLTNAAFHIELWPVLSLGTLRPCGRI
jgi:hypothetical protein